MVTHAIKKQDSSRWQSIEKVSLLQFCETTIKVLTPSALCRITVMRKKSPLLWLFSFFLFLTYSLLYTLKTHYRLTFSVHKQIYMRIEIWFHKQDYSDCNAKTWWNTNTYTRIRSNFLEDIFSRFTYETFSCIADNPMIRRKTSHSYIKPNFTRYCFTFCSNDIVFLYTVWFVEHAYVLPISNN